jgi:hypothetical protein
VYRELLYLRLCRHTRIMGRQHQPRGTLGENQHWQKVIIVYWEGMFRKITELLQQSWQQNWVSIWKAVSTKTFIREFHKSNIHGTSAIAKPVITANNAQIRKRWCRHHKNWTISELETLTCYGQLNHPLRCSMHQEDFTYVWRTPNPECLVLTMKHGEGSVMVWATISWYSVLLVPLLPFMAELL